MDETIKKVIVKTLDKTDTEIHGFLDWITEHKIYTVILLILITMGFSKIIKHYRKN